MKTFTCRELGGTYEMAFSGETFEGLMNQAVGHMMSDDAHRASIMGMEARTGENQEQWMTRMRAEFSERRRLAPMSA